MKARTVRAVAASALLAALAGCATSTGCVIPGTVRTPWGCDVMMPWAKDAADGKLEQDKLEQDTRDSLTVQRDGYPKMYARQGTTVGDMRRDWRLCAAESPNPANPADTKSCMQAKGYSRQE